jgi:hypothetical protein
MSSETEASKEDDRWCNGNRTRLLESRMMRKYQVRFGGGQTEKELPSHLVGWLPTFSDHSHGFRPERGCHTALREIYYRWQGTTWFIEVRRVGTYGIPVTDREGGEQRPLRTAAYLKGKPIQGQQPADQSGNRPKGGTPVFRKFSVHGETGTVEPEFPRDDNHIRHSLLMVTPPKYQVSFDDLGRLSSANGR